LHLLSDEDENVRDAALGTLVALHERGAVKVLAQSRQMRDAREMRKILDAIATLGGREAQEYLSFVAETHDDEEIRDMAKAALDRLERHGQSQSSQPNSLIEKNVVIKHIITLLVMVNQVVTSGLGTTRDDEAFVGRYRQIRRLSGGAFGDVYLVEDASKRESTRAQAVARARLRRRVCAVSSPA
jgi:hypothetical protein